MRYFFRIFSIVHIILAAIALLTANYLLAVGLMTLAGANVFADGVVREGE